MKLNILISTIDEGIYKIPDQLLSYRDDVDYLISHQNRNQNFLSVPDGLKRRDVIVSQIHGQGVTKCRNNGLKLAQGDVCVIADDDVTFSHSYFDTILKSYNEHNFDVTCFKINTLDQDKEYKKYPKTVTPIRSISEYSASAIEITFNRKAVINRHLQFDERFGLGSWLNTGHEDLFIYDAIKAGLSVGFIPEFIVEHPFESTIKAFPKYARRRVRAVGALDARLNGYKAIPKAFLGMIKYAPDLIRNKKNPVTYLCERLAGTIYVLK